MNVFLKYCLFVLIAFCINFELIEAITIGYDQSSPTIRSTQLVAYPQSARQVVNNFYDHCPDMPCDIAHSLQDTPTSKYISRNTNYPNKFNSGQDSCKKKNNNTHPSYYYSDDPVSYYVFGLRKIVI